MGHFVLSETSAGLALFKAKDKLPKISEEVQACTAEEINTLLKLKQFIKFDSAATALEEIATITDGKVSPILSQLLDSLKDEKKASLAVADPKLGAAINKIVGLNVTPIADSSTDNLYRAIREHLPSLIPGLPSETLQVMSLGLSHSLSRHKVKFSPDKVDTMIVQAISLLDDLDKELNTYAMRVKEWYGWHFPEMGKIVNDNLAYAKIILKVGMRQNTSNTDLEDILPEEIETAIKAAAEVSMGTEITEDDLENIQLLAEQVVGFTEYRAQLSSYLNARMLAIAPNLTQLVGELVGARLIAHAGSLMNLAKSPASTIQILGAEKALFRALKTKHDTPKYGLIYHSSLVGQATGKNKGKIARKLAAKSAIGIRLDALSDWSAQGEGRGDDIDEEERSAMSVTWRANIERQLNVLEGRPQRSVGIAVGLNGKATPAKWEIKEAQKYNKDADGLASDAPAAAPVLAEKVKITPEQVHVQEVEEDDSEDSDEEMADGETDGTNGVHSDTISTVSDDTPSPPESPAWESSITGNTNEAKKARKKERHERNVERASHKSEKRALKREREVKRAERAERRLKKDAQDKKRGVEKKEVEDPDIKNAAILDLDLEKYKKKLQSGQIKFENGKPIYLSKKDLKKLRKASESKDDPSSKKRKLEDVEDQPKKKKKKSKD